MIVLSFVTIMNIRRNRGKGGDDSHFSHQMTEKEKKENQSWQKMIKL